MFANAELEVVGRAGARAERCEAFAAQAAPSRCNRLLQRRVGREKVVVDEFDRLVEDFMRGGAVRVERRKRKLSGFT